MPATKLRVASSRAVRTSINRAEMQFTECWDTLASLRSRRVGRIIDFQTTLGQALRELSLAYTDLAAARDSLIKRKRFLDPGWFQQRQASLAALQGAIRQALAIGRALGDAFAWFFYQKSREILAAHLAHPREDRLLTGRGGAGEIEFVKNIRVLAGCFVLHHGITSMLRIGDVSLIDLDSLSVRALGELKTTPVDSQTSRVSVTLISGASLDLGHGFADIPKAAHVTASTVTPRFRRQIARMVKTMAPSQTSHPHIDVPLARDTRAAHLGRILANSAGRMILCERLSDALVIVVVRHRGRLFSRLTATLSPSFGLGLSEVVPPMALPNSKHNAILLRSLQYDHGGDSHVLRGAIPLFWSRIEPELLRPIILGEAIALSIYNPAHLLAKVEAQGFEVLPGRRPGDYVFEKREGDQTLRLEHSWYFVDLAASYLWEEDALVQLITDSIRQIGELAADGPVRVDFNFEHLLNSPSRLRRPMSGATTP